MLGGLAADAARSRRARSRRRCRRRSRRSARARPRRRRCSPAGTAARRRRRPGRRRPSRPGRCRPCRACPCACAMASLVPTPSVRAGEQRVCGTSSCRARNSPAKPPSPPTTSGRPARATLPFISSTARSPASMSTPAAAYDEAAAHGPRQRVVGATARASAEHGVHRGRPVRRRCAPTVCPRATAWSWPWPAAGRTPRGAREPLQDVLADEVALRDLDRVVAVEAGPAQPVGRLLAGARSAPRAMT